MKMVIGEILTEKKCATKGINVLGRLKHMNPAPRASYLNPEGTRRQQQAVVVAERVDGEDVVAHAASQEAAGTRTHFGGVVVAADVQVVQDALDGDHSVRERRALLAAHRALHADVHLRATTQYSRHSK